MLKRLFPAGLPIRFRFWDDSAVGPSDGPGEVVLRSPDALLRIAWSPGQLGMARAFVSGELDFEGDAPTVLSTVHDAMSRRLPNAAEVLSASLSALRNLRHLEPGVRLLRRPPEPPQAELRVSRWHTGAIHSERRDSAVVRHHYDVGNDFYRLVLGPAMTYSCARFETEQSTLEEAQRSKHDLVCRKLGLPERPGARLLDVGCGWGSMAMHAASAHDAHAVGVTLSPAQADLARKRTADAGLADRVDIRLQDYRELTGETFDAVSSIGMFEHVGERRMQEYFETIFSLISTGGRLLNHAISSWRGSKMRGRTFMNRYVFPDGELLDVAKVVRGMEEAGFEVRDVESLREHYARTLRCWVANLEERWDDAVGLVGEERARVWHLYMSASVNSFEDGSIAIHQVLGVKPDATGRSGMPATRRAWVAPAA